MNRQTALGALCVALSLAGCGEAASVPPAAPAPTVRAAATSAPMSLGCGPACAGTGQFATDPPTDPPTVIQRVAGGGFEIIDPDGGMTVYRPDGGGGLTVTQQRFR
jgi:hypothetical protein